MEKKPLIPVSEEPLTVLYESPSVMIVNKPRNLRVHPETEKEENTLLNRLFQDNRWLAGMENQLDAGVLHLFDEQDHGLMLFNKSDDYEDALQTALADNKVDFSFIVHVSGDTSLNPSDHKEINLELRKKQTQSGYSSFDIKTTNGNTSELRHLLFPEKEKTHVSFYCYAIGLDLPHSREPHVISLRDTERGIPHIAVYHAPP